MYEAFAKPTVVLGSFLVAILATTELLKCVGVSKSPSRPVWTLLSSFGDVGRGFEQP